MKPLGKRQLRRLRRSGRAAPDLRGSIRQFLSCAPPDGRRAAIESFYQVAEELPPLLVRQWEELEEDRDKIPLAVNWDAFLGYAAANVLFVCTVRVEGRLVGFIFNLVLPPLNHAGTKFCIVERFWLAPEHRGGWFAVRWFRRNAEHAKKIGAVKIVVTENVAFMRGREAFFRRLGYAPAQVSFAKLL